MRYRMNPGSLKHKITFQKLGSTKNSYGELKKDNDNWINYKDVRAAIYPVSGREFFSAEKVNSEVTHKVNLRYIKGLSPDMRIKFGDRLFSIISIINFQERNTELQILAKELL